MGQKHADGTANSVDPDQTAVWSGSALFAKTCLCENLGSLEFSSFWYWKWELGPYFGLKQIQNGVLCLKVWLYDIESWDITIMISLMLSIIKKKKHFFLK